MDFFFLGGVIFLLVFVIGPMAFTAVKTRRIEATLPPCGQFIDVDGARIHYLEKGSGPVILMIHGLGGNLRNFTHSMVTPLADEFRVIAIDRPGSGYSTRAPDAPASIVRQGEQVAGFIRALKLERPLIVGHSMGGAVALALALDHPQLVGGLALLAPVSHIQNPAPPPFQPLLIESTLLRRMVAWTVAMPLSLMQRDSVLAVLFGPDPCAPDMDIKGGGLLALRPRNFYSASSDLVAANHSIGSMVERYSELSVPVSVLFGTADRVLDWRRHGQALAEKVAGLQLTCIEQGGHMLPISHAQHCVDWIREMAREAKDK